MDSYSKHTISPGQALSEFFEEFGIERLTSSTPGRALRAEEANRALRGAVTEFYELLGAEANLNNEAQGLQPEPAEYAPVPGLGPAAGRLLFALAYTTELRGIDLAQKFRNAFYAQCQETAKARDAVEQMTLF